MALKFHRPRHPRGRDTPAGKDEQDIGQFRPGLTGNNPFDHLVDPGNTALRFQQFID
ncbi:MAG: hypothetical protein U5O39_03975 [Gammaproteobacteria bacterium]|nr:hypothetical protein [Gammaproteobacteria bacterium]